MGAEEAHNVEGDTAEKSSEDKEAQDPQEYVLTIGTPSNVRWGDVKSMRPFSQKLQESVFEEMQVRPPVTKSTRLSNLAASAPLKRLHSRAPPWCHSG